MLITFSPRYLLTQLINDMTKINQHILTCGGTGCRASESKALADKLKEELRNCALDENVKVVESGCSGGTDRMFWFLRKRTYCKDAS